MKKIFTLITLFFAVAGTAMAGDYVAYQQTAPVSVYWNSNEDSYQPEIKFPALSTGDVINIYVTNVSSDFSYNIIWRGLTSDDWRWLTLTSGSSCENGVISYTVNEADYKIDDTDYDTSAADVATSLKERGLVLTGKFKVLGVSVTSSEVGSNGSYTFSTVVSESKALGEDDDTNDDTKAWSPFVDLRYCDYSKVEENDILHITYSVTESKSGQIQLQNNWGKYNDATDKGNLSGTGSIDLTITSEMLSIMQETGSERDNNFVLKGKNTTVTGVCILKTLPTAGYRPVYIPTGRYATFYGTSTCELPSGVAAYYVSATTSESATLTSISNIPANQGVILAGATGIYQLYSTEDAAASVTGNKLVGAATRTQITDVTNKYVLYDNGGSPEFRSITADTYLDAYKCYLSTSTPSGSRSLDIIFGGDGTTGIESVAKELPQNDRIYNLKGQEVKNPTHGLYIKNGKKYFVK